MAHHLRYAFQVAAEECRYLCPLCEKPTPPNEANVTYRKGDTLEARDSFGATRVLWKCKHCGATHRDGSEKLVK